MAKRVEYKDLKTIDDVRRERLRIQQDIQRTNDFLEDDAQRIGELFSVDYWGAILSVKIAEIIERATSGLASRIRGFSSVFGLVSNLAGGLFRGSSRPAYSGRVRSNRYYDDSPDYRYDSGEDGYDDEEEFDIIIERDRSC